METPSVWRSHSTEECTAAWRVRVRAAVLPLVALELFCLDGWPIDPRDDWEDWEDILRDAGVRYARVHDGRHTAATLLLEYGVDVRIVMEILRHPDLRVTTRYTHIAMPLAEEAARRMGQALWGAQEPTYDPYGHEWLPAVDGSEHSYF